MLSIVLCVWDHTLNKPTHVKHSVHSQCCLSLGWYGCMRVKSLQLCPTLCSLLTAAHQAPLSTGFSRQKYRSGLSCPPPTDLPELGVKPAPLNNLSALACGLFTTSTTWEAQGGISQSNWLEITQLVVVIFYKITLNTDLANPKPLLIREMPDWVL